MKKSIISLSLLLSVTQPTFAEEFSFTSQLNSNADTLLVFKQQGKTSKHFDTLNTQSSSHLSNALLAAEFKAKLGQTATILAPNNLPYKRVVVVGLGNEALTKQSLTKLGGDLSGKLELDAIKEITFDTSVIGHPDAAALLAHGINLRAYRFETYTKKKRKQKSFTIASSSSSSANDNYSALANIEQGVFLARDLISETATEMTPKDFVKAAKELKQYGVKVTVLEPKKIKKLGMGALEAVGRGSSQGSRLIVAHYEGSDDAPIALVGKGITFDSGGYSIKTGKSIARMKSDMAGAAAALGTVKALALNKSKHNVVAVMGMAANMVSETSVAPGDVVKTAEGLTVEILNTDAEGRLVLSDALWYAREHYKPQVMVDIATLTGSKVGAVGNRYAAVFSDDDALVNELTVAGKEVNENLWRLPLGYKDMLKSPIADLANIGSSGPGATTAATFLQQFVGDTKWAHIDIAGNALASSGKGEVAPGGTGYSVRLLTNWIENHKK